MSTAGMTDFFALYAVLLRGKGKGSKGGETNGGGVGCGCRVGMIAKLKGDV